MQKQKLSINRIIITSSLATLLFFYVLQIGFYVSGRSFKFTIAGTEHHYANRETVAEISESLRLPKKLSASNHAFVIMPNEIDLSVDQEVLNEPFAKRWQVLIPLWGMLKMLSTQTIEPRYSVNNEKIAFIAEKITLSGQREPIDAKVIIDGGTVTLLPETNGVKLQRGDVISALSDISTKDEQIAELRSEIVRPEVTIDTLQPAVEKLTSLTSKSLKVAFDDTEFIIAPEKVAQLLSVAGVEVMVNQRALTSLIADWSLQLSKPAGVTQEEYYDDALVSSRKGEYGVTIDNEAVARAIEQWITEPKTEEIKFDKVVIAPKVNRTFRYSRSSQQLQSKLDAWVANNPGRYMIAVQELNGQGRQAMINGERITVMASTYKMFLAYAAYTLSENGQLDLGSTVYNGKTIEQCIEEGIVYSDNPCPISIGRKIGWQTATDIINDAGFSSVFMNNYFPDGSFNGDKRVHANDQAKFLMQLSAGQLLNSANTDKLLGYMKRQVYRDGIPAGSGGSVVADKVGFLDGYFYHDVGIVYGPKSTYALVVLTEESGWSYIRDVAEAVYQFMQE